jgi:hypothetical protein
VVDVCQRAAAADLYELGVRIDPHPTLCREVDDESTVSNGEARWVVTCAADRDVKPLLARVADRNGDIRRVEAACDRRGILSTVLL